MLPELESYSARELSEISWPAIRRYLNLIQSAPTGPDFQSRLRLDRHREWLRAAIATCLRKSSAEDVCREWSASADRLVLEAWRESGCENQGYALVALGKLGSQELNLSSDVDLIAVRRDDTPLETKCIRQFQSLLSDLTEFGYCLRTDFNLRPGGRSSSIIPSMTEFEFHYGYHGEMWERLAFVRRRILAGPPDLVSQIESFSEKFSFRRHLDFTVMDDLRALQNRFREEMQKERTDSIHLKLGRGGIRQLELFVHALQIIHGGKQSKLRTGSTTNAIACLEELSLIPKDESRFLHEAYWQMRDFENRIQAYDDQQDYWMDFKKSEPLFTDGEKKSIRVTMDKVAHLTSSLLGGENAKSNSVPSGEENQLAWLKSLGFSDEIGKSIWPELLEATALSRKTERDEAARMEFLKSFVEDIGRGGVDINLGISLLLDFVRAVRAKASFFTLLNRNDQVRQDLARLFSISPYLGSILTSRPELIDEFIFRKQAQSSPDLETLLEELAERRLLVELIAAQEFLSDPNVEKLGENLTASADAIALELLTKLRESEPSTLKILALGKWGGRELGFRSDLDFIFISDVAPEERDHKLAKKFLLRMTEAHRGGAIFSIDMRLRPSGQAGPILVSRDELTKYLQTKAAAWERQAYLRAREIEPSAGFSPAREGSQLGLSSSDLNELSRIKSQLFKEMGKDELDLKQTFGGLADTEFTAQIALLKRREFSLDPSTSGMIQYLEAHAIDWKVAGPDLRKNYLELRRLEQLYQLTTRQSGSKIRIKSQEFSRLAKVLGLTTEDLVSRIRNVLSDNREILRKVQTT